MNGMTIVLVLVIVVMMITILIIITIITAIIFIKNAAVITIHNQYMYITTWSK